MRHRYLAVVFLVSAIFLIPAAAFAQDKEVSPADTSSASDLFNPPRVITPEHGREPQAGQDLGTTAAAPQAEETERKHRCASCYQNTNSRGGGGGQFDIGVAFLNLDDINAQVRQMGIPALSDEILILGGKGYGRIGHFIIGGGGCGGYTESSGIPDCCARYARLDFGYGGIILGASTYGSRHQLMAGILMGGGQAKVTRRRNSREIMGWDDAWDPFRKDGPDSVASEDLNMTSELTGSFIALEPFVSFKYWLCSFMALDLSASYLRAEIGRGQWKLDGVKIPDSPESNLGGPILKIGVHFGV